MLYFFFEMYFFYGERGLWWIAYTFVGIAVPVALNTVYKKALRIAGSFFIKKEC